jgi:hypothetical protein
MTGDIAFLPATRLLELYRTKIRRAGSAKIRPIQ